MAGDVYTHCYRSDIVAYYDGQDLTLVDKTVGVCMLSVDIDRVSVFMIETSVYSEVR